MRYIAKENSYLEGWDVIDTQEVVSDVQDEMDHPLLMTIYDESIVEKVLSWLNYSEIIPCCDGDRECGSKRQP